MFHSPIQIYIYIYILSVHVDFCYDKIFMKGQAFNTRATQLRPRHCLVIILRPVFGLSDSRFEQVDILRNFCFLPE